MSKLSLKIQLVLGAVTLGIVLLLVQSSILFYTLKGELSEEIEKQQFALLSEVATNLDEKIEERLIALARESETVPLEALSDKQRLETHLRSEAALLTVFDDLYVFDASGVLLVDWPEKPGRRGLDMSARDYIQEVRETRRPFVSRPILGKSTKQPIIVVATPILDSRGQLAGILAGVLNLFQPNLLGSLPNRKIGETGYFYVVASDRTLISHPDKSRILQPVAHPGANPVLDLAIEGFEGTREGVNSRGLSGLFTFKRLKSTNWILASVVPAEEAFRPISGIHQKMAVTTVALICLLTPLLGAFARHLVRPLGQFAEALRERAQNIRPGIPAAPVTTTGWPEIRTVADAFNEFLVARNEAESRQRLATRVFETTVEAVVVTDHLAKVMVVNPAFSQITGYSEQEVLGQGVGFLQSDRQSEEFYRALWKTLETSGQWSGEIWSCRKSGEVFPMRLAVSTVRDQAGLATNFVFVFSDVSEIHQAEKAAEHLSWHDTLTGLANRPFFLQQLERTLGEARKNGSFATVLLLDLDRFKDINEARGLSHGDALLKLVAQRLAHILYSGDLLARLDSDEFAVLLARVFPSREKAGRAALAVAERIHQTLRDGIEWEGAMFHLNASIGIAQLPETAQEAAADVLRQADTAMHQAKAEGGGRTVFFESAMGKAVRERYELEQELRNAVRFNQLRLYLQPQVNSEGQDIGAEALVRWQHPSRGLVPPGVFIPLAEMSDLVVTIDRWMLSEVCDLLVNLDRSGNSQRISVNISPRHFQRADFVDEVTRLLSDSGADPTRLVLEVTESLLIENMADAVAKMTQLTELGVQFSLDDFGTGYSSLAHLKQLPIHELKIDRSFIKDAPVDPNDAALVETILTVAQHLRLQVVAEGVETQAHAEFLRGYGEVVHQGFLHGRPMPVETWLARHATRGLA